MENSNTEALIEVLSQNFGDAIQHSEMAYDMMVVEVSKSKIHEILEFLQTHPVYQFNFLTTMCGLHFPDAVPEKQLGMMYQLHSFVNNLRIRIKTFFPDTGISELPTISDIYPAANWMERQEYDFFGFRFVGHPDLRRILNVDDMVMFPMRKEYPLEDQTREDKDDTMFGRK